MNEPTKTLTAEQQQQLRMLKAHFPHRIVYGVLEANGAFSAYAKHTRAALNKLVRDGFTVFVMTNPFHTMNTNHPNIGQRITVRGIVCRIIAIRPTGMIDVASLDGKHHWRISGLSFTSQQTITSPSTP